MFERSHHQCIGRVLESIDADLLLKHRCLFGGGTAIALTRGEYRESVDVDFVCSSVDGYREVRGLVNKGGLQALLTRPLTQVRAPRIDQYGVRGALEVDGVPIKFEVIFEGRVQLADPVPEDRVGGVWALAMEDKVATKLMANSDRWADDSVMSRDVIDLAMLTSTGGLDPVGIAKAKRAYGDSIFTDFEKARTQLLARDGRLQICMKHLGMTMPTEDLRRRIEVIHLVSSEPVPRRRLSSRPRMP